MDASSTDPVEAVADPGQAEGTAPETLADALGDGEQLIDEIEQSITRESGGEPGAEPVHPMPLDRLEAGGDDAETKGARDLRLLADIDVEVAVEFGRTRMPLRQLLGLRRGSLVELGRSPDQQVSVLANGTVVAYGDIVLVGDQVGVHILELAPPSTAPAPAADLPVVDPAERLAADAAAPAAADDTDPDAEAADTDDAGDD